MRNLLRKFKRDEDGIAAVETALLAPIFIPLLLGTLELLFILYTSTSMDRAAQATAMEIRLGQSASLAAATGLPPEAYYKMSICDRIDMLNCQQNLSVNITTYTEEGAQTASFSDQFVNPGTLARVDITLDMDMIGFLSALKGSPIVAETSLLFHTEPF